MQRKVSKEKFNYGGKSKTSQDIIQQHMSNHYRKILNAKKTVDNGTPQGYKAKRPASNNQGVVKIKVNRQLESPALTDRSISTNSNKGSCWGAESVVGSSRYHTRCIPECPTFGATSKNGPVDMDLINRITYDTKKGPSSYSGENWTDTKSQHSVKDYKTGVNTKENTVKNSSSTTKRPLPASNLQESAQKRKLAFQDPDPSTPSNQRINSPLDVSPYKCSKMATYDPQDSVLKKITFNPKEQSLTSSRDSAYNEGVSSLPESRSPTPDERKKNNNPCFCCCGKNKINVEETSKSSKTENKKVVNDTACEKEPKNVSPCVQEEEKEEEEKLKKIKEDELYVKFIQDITTEVLEKNLYTNKALNKVMKKHIKNNLINLNQDRMLKEVEYLRTQLGIPEDKTLLQLEGNLEESENDCNKQYPIISDSEFVMPKNQTNTNTNTNTTSALGDEKITKKNNRQVFPMIQMVQQNKIPMAISPENSFDDSDQPFAPENLPIFKKNIQISDSCSSSSSFESEIFTEKNTTSEEFHNFTYKKSRTVSFWKNPELNFTRNRRTIEIKQKNNSITTTPDKKSIIQDKKEKTKND